jgi:septal ring factor EnvC (AmiA/AmiB activator)
MTPEEIEQTMEFILRSQADAVVRMDRIEEERKEQQNLASKLQEQIGTLGGIVQEHLGMTGQLMETTRALQESNRIMSERVQQESERLNRESERRDRADDLLAVLTRIAEAHSIRLDDLEKH